MPHATPSSEIVIGTHRVSIDGDTVLVRWIGTPEYEDVRAIHEHFEQVIAKYGYLFAINDMQRSGFPSAPTRKWIVEWMIRYPMAVLVVNFGASLPVRALQTMIFRAMALIGSRPPVETVHCASEAEAFALVEQRRRLQG